MYPISTSTDESVDLFTTLFDPSQYAKHQFQRVLNASGYRKPLCFYASLQIKNALAISKPIYNTQYPYELIRYDRFIIYNPNFMRHMEFTGGNEFVTLSIFAHELGHHVYDHTDKMNPVVKHPWDKEVEADYYSGYVLARLGAEAKDLEQSQRLMFSMWPSATHPDSYRRISSIVRGWKDGGGSTDGVQDDLAAIYEKINNEFNRWN